MWLNIDPDPVRIQGFGDQKLEIKDFQATDKAFSTSKHEIS
jgi:hypothetical protein